MARWWRIALREFPRDRLRGVPLRSEGNAVGEGWEHPSSPCGGLDVYSLLKDDRSARWARSRSRNGLARMCRAVLMRLA